MTNTNNISIQITSNIFLSVEGYVAFQSTKNWWEKEKAHNPAILHWSGNEYFIPVLVEYYQEEQSLEANKLKNWALFHSWLFDRWGEQYHLVCVEEDNNPSVIIKNPETDEIVERYSSPSVMWEALRDFCLPVAVNFK